MPRSLLAGWKLTRLSEVGRVVTGTTPPKEHPEYYGGETPFVTPRELDAIDPIIEAPTTLSRLGASKAKVLPAGTILISCIGSLGKVGLAGVPLATNQQINAIIPGGGTDSRYLFHFCRTLKPLLEQRAPSTTLQIVKKTLFESLGVPLPPLPEQRRIAAILDKADAVCRKRQKALDLADQFLRSAFRDMFGDPVTNPKGWPLKPLGTVMLEVYRYPTYYGISYADIGVPEIRGELLQRDGSIAADGNHLRYISADTSARFPRTVVSEGDLVMSVRGTVGKVGVVPAALAGANITANLIRMAPDRRLVTSTYLWHYMQTATFRMQLADACSSTTILTIRAPDLKRIDIPVPPLVLQGSYSNVAGVVQRLGAQHLAAAEQAAALFASLQEKAFGGSAALLAHPYGET